MSDKAFDRFASPEFGGDDDEDESVNPVNTAMDNVVSAFADDEDIDEELREAEKVLGKANYYKAIIRDGVLVEDGSPQVTEINAEVRLWARQQVARLLKLTSAEPVVQKVEPPFSEKEIDVLKALVSKLLIQRGESPSEPQVKRIQNEAPAPQVRKLRNNEAPAAQQPRPSKKPAPQAQAKQQSEQPAAPKVSRPKLVKPNADGVIDYDAIETGVVFRDQDRQLYKFVPHPDEDNRRVKIKVTGQVRNPAAKPMPLGDQMSMISEIQARETLAAGATASDGDSGGTARISGIPIMVAAAAKSLQG